MVDHQKRTANMLIIHQASSCRFPLSIQHGVQHTVQHAIQNAIQRYASLSYLPTCSRRWPTAGKSCADRVKKIAKTVKVNLRTLKKILLSILRITLHYSVLLVCIATSALRLPFRKGTRVLSQTLYETLQWVHKSVYTVCRECKVRLSTWSLCKQDTQLNLISLYKMLCWWIGRCPFSLCYVLEC